ncbi:MAG TPA: hypothetical protein ENH55_08125 [Aurantimonas coralicida]|uniref:Uncharacterized protein n=2 Tax=root TaxID=1 RepID=A0A9C9TJ59_9HYPH|nr:hypothetical protein [Aurantimonas coralicida]HEU03300.1 hypothetical protein [Aurantimonas coralicida]
MNSHANLDISRRRDLVIDANEAVVNGKGAEDRIDNREGFGRSLSVADALKIGVEIEQDFCDEAWPLVVRAFARFGLNPPSRAINECCRDLCKRLPVGLFAGRPR